MYMEIQPRTSKSPPAMILIAADGYIFHEFYSENVAAAFSIRGLTLILTHHLPSNRDIQTHKQLQIKKETKREFQFKIHRFSVVIIIVTGL